MIKRTLDLAISVIGILVLFLPISIIAMLIWIYDFGSPFYISKRVGINGKDFRMIKLRSMCSNADENGPSSTSKSDARITPIGKFIRAIKFDEFPQLLNVLKGDMSLVGPRPQVRSAVILYTDLEMKLLNVRPGITDISSIVFSDEAQILEGAHDPDISYNQLIRPGKNYLGLFYVKNQTLFFDISLIILTVVAIFSKGKALFIMGYLLKAHGATDELIEMASRNKELVPSLPPGS